MTDVTYKTHKHGSTQTMSSTVECWVHTELKKGGIESQLSKLQGVVAMLADNMIGQRPELLGELADEIECDGTDHKIDPWQSFSLEEERK